MTCLTFWSRSTAEASYLLFLAVFFCQGSPGDASVQSPELWMLGGTSSSAVSIVLLHHQPYGWQEAVEGGGKHILCYPAQAASRSQLLGVTATVVFLNSIVPVGPPACGKNSAFFDDSVPSALEVIPGGPA